MRLDLAAVEPRGLFDLRRRRQLLRGHARASTTARTERRIHRDASPGSSHGLHRTTIRQIRLARLAVADLEHADVDLATGMSGIYRRDSTVIDQTTTPTPEPPHPHRQPPWHAPLTSRVLQWLAHV